MALTRARRIIFGTTAGTWGAVCGFVLWNLIRRAAEAPPATIEEYAREPSYQIVNFVVGYLPFLVLLLAVLLGVEHVALWGAERLRRSGPSRP